MRRKLTLAVLGIVTLSASVACAAPASPPGSRRPRLPDPGKVDGDRVVTLLPPDAIPAIDEPRFVPAAEADFMRDDEPVVGVVHGGVAKAYSLWHLDRHEVVNDRFGKDPVAVTW